MCTCMRACAHSQQQRTPPGLHCHHLLGLSKKLGVLPLRENSPVKQVTSAVDFVSARLHSRRKHSMYDARCSIRANELHFLLYACNLSFEYCPVERAFSAIGLVSRVGQNQKNTVYICISGIFGREITKYTVIYGVHIRFWPTLLVRC